MTAILGSSSNLYTGIKQYGQITNTYAGYLQSAAAAYTVSLPFLPDKFEVVNYTKFGTDSNTLLSIWYRDMPAAYALQITRGTTTLSSALTTTNGFTLVNTAAAFTDQHKVIQTASAGVVTTTTNHGYSNNDRVIITKLAGDLGAEWNDREFVIQVQSATTFKLYDVYGNAITQVAAYSSGGQSTREGPRLGIVNSQPVYGMTLGTNVMGNDNDVLYFTAYQFNSYYNLGDVA